MNTGSVSEMVVNQDAEKRNISYFYISGFLEYLLYILDICLHYYCAWEFFPHVCYHYGPKSSNS